MPNNHGLADEFGVVEKLDRSEERIHIDVQDRGGRIVYRADRDLPVTSVLLAHAVIISPAADDGLKRKRERMPQHPLPLKANYALRLVMSP